MHVPQFSPAHPARLCPHKYAQPRCDTSHTSSYLPSISHRLTPMSNTFDAFKAAFFGDILTPADEGYAVAIARWAKNAVRKAALVVYPKDSADVSRAITYARGAASSSRSGVAGIAPRGHQVQKAGSSWTCRVILAGCAWMRRRGSGTWVGAQSGRRWTRRRSSMGLRLSAEQSTM